MPACPPAVKALLMEDARLKEWLFSRPAIEPETEVDTGPREEKNSSCNGLLEKKITMFTGCYLFEEHWFSLLQDVFFLKNIGLSFKKCFLFEEKCKTTHFPDS